MLLYGLVFIILAVSTLAGNMTIDDLINSYDYSYNNGTINVTSYSDFMIDGDSDGTNDTLVINLTTNGTVGTYSFIVELVDQSGILVNQSSKTVTAVDSAHVSYASELLSQNAFNYSVRINNINDHLVFRKFDIQSQSHANYETGTNITSVSDENVGDGFIRLHVTVNSSETTTKNVTAVLLYNDSSISKTAQASLTQGIQNVTIDFDNETIKSTHYNGNFLVSTVRVGDKTFTVNKNTSSYNYEDFAKTSYVKAISSGVVDQDANNLSEFLEINFTIEVKSSDDYTLSYDLYDSEGEFVANMSKTQTLFTGLQSIQTLINGSKIYQTKLSGPYEISSVKLVKDTTLDTLFNAHTTGDNHYSEFERPPLPDLVVSIEKNFSPASNTTDVTINITNSGAAPAFNILVDVFDTNISYENQSSVEFMGPNESTLFVFTVLNATNNTDFLAIVDFDNLVDESDEANNIDTTQMIVSDLKVPSLSLIYSDGLRHVFEFSIENNSSSLMENISWSLDLGDGTVINSTSDATLESAESLFVYYEHIYESNGIYDVTASAFSNGGQASENIAVLISPLTVNNLAEISTSGAERTFEFTITNLLQSSLSSVEWTFDTGNSSVIQSQNNATLISNETIFVFIEYDYQGNGNFMVNASARNNSLSDYEVLDVVS